MQGTPSSTPEPNWSRRLSLADADRMAPDIFRLRARPHAWLNRRVETVRLSEPQILHRSISLDMTIPNVPALRGPNGGPFVLLPITLLKKRPLRTFDLRDADGASL